MTLRNERLARYGLTEGVYDFLCDYLQDGVCAICYQQPAPDRALAVDHDHTIGHIRGLLCARCNMGLGHFRDDPELLERAATYLRRSGPLRPDCCNQCGDGQVHWPAQVEPRRSGGTVARYACASGHTWTCGWGY